MPPFTTTNNSKTLTPQAALVLDYLTSGRMLTPIVAHMTLGVASLTARIAELRAAGYKIADSWEADHFQRRYKSYWMEAAKDVPPTATP